MRGHFYFGNIETEYRTVDGGIVEHPIEDESTGYAWTLPGGTWGGWYATKEEAIDAAWPGAFIVERKIIQRLHGIKAATTGKEPGNA